MNHLRQFIQTTKALRYGAFQLVSVKVKIPVKPSEKMSATTSEPMRNNESAEEMGYGAADKHVRT
jgi:hypothetical protein